MKRRAVITGLGIVSPIGVGVDNFWRAACAGKSGIRRPSLFDASKLSRECQMVGEVTDFNPRDWMSPTTARMAGRFSQFAIASSKMALEDSGLDLTSLPSDQVKVSFGTSMNGQTDVAQPNFTSFVQTGEVAPYACLEYPAHAATSHVAMTVGARGQTATFATACGAGLDAVGWAAEEVCRGNASAVITGATETPLSAFTMQIFQSVGVLSKWEGDAAEASRPFDRWRSGLVLSEGAAAVVIEDEDLAQSRGAKIYCRIESFVSVSEGAHLRKIDETGEAVSRVIRAALQRGDVIPETIDYVCAHGNAMPDYDAAETAGIKHAFGRRAWNIPISSLKSMCGQALAASSAMQIVVSCLTLRHQVITPTINYTTIDPRCDLDYVPNTARRSRVRTILVHAHSLGGSHSAIILGAPA
jgi:3-oxoacyl-[acyl-carrier-protein] synthase II